MSGTTPRLALYKPAEGDGLDNGLTWFAQMNENLDKLDAAVPWKASRHALATTPSLAYFQTANLEIQLTQSCELISTLVDHECWVRVYGSAAARTQDAARQPDTQAPKGRGLYAQTHPYPPDDLTTQWSSAPFFHSLDTPKSDTAYLAVTNMAPGYEGPINLDFEFLPQEQFTPSPPQGGTGLSGRTLLVVTAPPTALQGQDGDSAFDKVAKVFYGPKSGGAWPAGVSLQGLPGLDGINGKQLRSGPADPTAADGVDGEFWVNYTTHYLFGPKTAGAWPTGVDLVGLPGANGTSFAWRGAWSNATAYAVNDMSSSGGSTYIAILAGTNHDPATSPTFWQLMAEKGADGAGGGVSVYTVAGLPAGSAGTVAFATNLIETCGAPFYSDGTRAVFRATPPSTRSGSTLRVSSWQGLHQPVELSTTYNTCQYSEDQAQAFWTKTGVTIGSNTGTAPNGTATSDKWLEDTSNGEHGSQAGNQAYVSGTPYSFSVHALAAERSILRILLPAGAFTENKIAYFDLSSGTVTGTSGTGITTSITSLLAGGYRVSISATATASITTITAQLRMCNTGTNASYAGTLNSGMYVWGSQMEPRATPSYYKGPTTTATLTYTISAAGDDITFSPAPPVGKTYAWTQQGGLVYHTGTAWVRASDRTPIAAWF